MGNYISKLSAAAQSACPAVLVNAAESFKALYEGIQLGDVPSTEDIFVFEAGEDITNIDYDSQEMLERPESVESNCAPVPHEEIEIKPQNCEETSQSEKCVQEVKIVNTMPICEEKSESLQLLKAIVKPTIRPVDVKAVDPESTQVKATEIVKMSLDGLLPSDNPTKSLLTWLPYNDQEARTVAKNFARFCGGKRTVITNIYKLNNAWLRALYRLKKAELEHSTGKKFQERLVYHGTSSANAIEICKGNFNPRLWKRARHGQGVCFSPRSSFASYNCGNSSTKSMLVCKVLFNAAHPGEASTIVPKPGYDATSDLNKRVIVKYHDDVFIPEYLVEFHIIQPCPPYPPYPLCPPYPFRWW